jgi:hypothetical protein
MRRVRLRRRDRPTPADPLFVRLCQALQLTYVVKAQIARGITAPEYLSKVKNLERDAWIALQGYVAAQAFVAEIEGRE